MNLEIQARRRLPRGCGSLILFALLFWVPGCGKVGAPIPPVTITERTSSLDAVQRGNSVVLTWPVPPLGREASQTSYIQRADIYRLIERTDQEPSLFEDEYGELASILGSLDRDDLEAQAATGRLQFTDVIDLSRSAQNTRLRYAVRYINAREQKGRFSNTVTIEPFPTVATAPDSVRVIDRAQDAITLSWSAPESNVNGTQPAAVVGYNIYRWNARRGRPREPLNDEPIPNQSFVDRRFQYDVEYLYAVRALSQGSTGLIESTDSQPLRVEHEDDFPPSIPNPVSIASANAVISLFWPSSPERDVAGYYIYRAESVDAPPDKWVKLNESPIQAVTFRDDGVSTGTRYYYRVTAVDIFSNESDPSPVVNETANP